LNEHELSYETIQELEEYMKQADNDDDKSDLSNIQKNTGIALNNH